jgi:hypothetical protein
MKRTLPNSAEDNPRGSAVIIAMVLVLLFAGLSVILANEMLSRSLRVQIAQEDLLAFEAAEAGIDCAINDINQSPTVRLLTDGQGSYATDVAGDVAPSWNPPNPPWKQLFTNDNHPIYVHVWNYDGNPAHRRYWYRPGCLGTQYWMPASSTGQVIDPSGASGVKSGSIGPNAPFYGTAQTSTYLNTGGGHLNYAAPLDAAGNTNLSFCPNDNLIPSGPLNSSYVSRPMWKPVPVPTFAVNSPGYYSPWAGQANGPEMAHENNITPLSLGDTAFFTYAIDWLHDGVDNNPLPPDISGNPQSLSSGLPVSPYTQNYVSVDDPSERNKYTLFSSGIHMGQRRAGVSESGTVVTIEVTLCCRDFDSPIIQSGPLSVYGSADWRKAKSHRVLESGKNTVDALAAAAPDQNIGKDVLLSFLGVGQWKTRP